MAFHYSPKIVTDGLVLCLDAGNPKSYIGSGTWSDISRGGNNGTLANGPTFSSLNGGSIVFDGIDDRVILGTNTILGSLPFSLSAWLNVKTHSTFGISLYIGNNQLSQSAYLGFVSGASLGVSNSIGGGLYGVNYGSGVLTNTGYHNVVLTFAGGSNGQLILYVDGIVKISGGTTPNLQSTSTRIGSDNSNAYPFNGNVSISSVYNRALSSQEILQNFNATKTRYGL